MENKKRHKCHFCGAVRFEEYMTKLLPRETTVISQWGNQEKCWACSSSRDCNYKDQQTNRPEKLALSK